MATVYDYIAENNPQQAKQLCETFGYRVTNPRNMSSNLKVLINNEGEHALKSLMELHPDKEILIDYFGAKKKSEGCGCGCNSKATPTSSYAGVTSIIVGVSCFESLSSSLRISGSPNVGIPSAC